MGSRIQSFEVSEPVLLRLPALLLSGCVDYTLQDPDENVATPVIVEERFLQEALPKVDVLFVVDSTGSMAEEQTSFAEAAADFVAELQSLEISYQLGVVTTDPEDQGVLLGRPWVLTDADSDPASALAAALMVGVESPPPAAGLYSATLALADVSGLNRGFRRVDAGLQVIFVSDGDDESDAWLGGDPAAAFSATLAAEALRTGLAARASAVVGDVPDGCEGQHGDASPGLRYASVAEDSGGGVASICSADFAAVAAGLGGGSVDWSTRFPLQAEPAPNTITVDVDGERHASGWNIDGSTLVFDQAPAPDVEIRVRYQLASAS